MAKWCVQIAMVLAGVFVGGCVSDKSQESPMLSGIETLQEEIRWDGGHDVADYGKPEVNATIETLLSQWFGSPVPFGAKVGDSASGTNRVPIKVVKDPGKMGFFFFQEVISKPHPTAPHIVDATSSSRTKRRISVLAVRDGDVASTRNPINRGGFGNYLSG